MNLVLNELEIMNNKQENFDFDSVASDFIVINFSQNPNRFVAIKVGQKFLFLAAINPT